MPRKNRILNLENIIFGSSCPIEENNNIALLGGLILKSSTLNPKEGRPNNYWENRNKEGFHTLNSLGLPNIGLENFLIKKVPSFFKYEIPLIISIVIEEEKEILPIFNILSNYFQNANKNIFGIEINISCPNIKEEKNKIEYAKTLIDLLRFKYKDIIISIKVSYCSTLDSLIELQKMDIDILNCFNTLPINIGDFKAGLGGSFLKEKYIERIKEIKNNIQLPIIGTGGITSKNDIEDYLNAGCFLIAVGSYFLENKENMKDLVLDFYDLK